MAYYTRMWMKAYLEPTRRKVLKFAISRFKDERWIKLIDEKGWLMRKVDWWESWLMRKLIDEKVDWWEGWLMRKLIDEKVRWLLGASVGWF